MDKRMNEVGGKDGREVPGIWAAGLQLPVAAMRCDAERAAPGPIS